MKLLMLFLPFCGAVAVKEALVGTRGDIVLNLEKVPSEEQPLKPMVENLRGGKVVLVNKIDLNEVETGASDGRICYSADEPCKPWTENNGKSYTFVDNRQTWANAQVQCRGMNAQLAIVNNQQDEDYVKGLALGKEAWIGLSDAEQAFSWFWINGDLLSYTDWCLNEPSNWGNVERCVEINYTEKKCWNDLRCDIELPFVCQRD